MLEFYSLKINAHKGLSCCPGKGAKLTQEVQDSKRSARDMAARSALSQGSLAVLHLFCQLGKPCPDSKRVAKKGQADAEILKAESGRTSRLQATFATTQTELQTLQVCLTSCCIALERAHKLLLLNYQSSICMSLMEDSWNAKRHQLNTCCSPGVSIALQPI